jgi:PAS domain S-box-containing protein
MTLDLLCIASTDGYFLRLNPAWEKVLGYSLTELMSKRFLEFVHPDDIAATKAAVQELAGQKQVVDFANRYRRNDGAYRQMLWSAAAVGDLIYAAARDVTERLQAEETLRQREKELQSLTGRLILGQEEERRRLARELHDDLSQRLAVLAIQVGKTETAVKDERDPLLKPLRELRDQAIQIAADVHGISRRLHPSILDDLGLSKAVESECARFSTIEGVDIVCSAQNIPVRLPRDISLSIYRIVQEGLNNIAKHACARHVIVSLSDGEAELHLFIKDDGIGFDAAEVRRRPGLGLSSIRERVRLVHGRHRITSEPEKGTTIEVTVPLKSESPKETSVD